MIRWITLKKLKWSDPDGKEVSGQYCVRALFRRYVGQRLWECAERKTRGSSGVDGEKPEPHAYKLFIYHLLVAVAVLALVRSKTNAFPLSTVVIEQYRPPIDKFIIGESQTCVSEELGDKI